MRNGTAVELYVGGGVPKVIICFIPGKTPLSTAVAHEILLVLRLIGPGDGAQKSRPEAAVFHTLLIALLLINGKQCDPIAVVVHITGEYQQLVIYVSLKGHREAFCLKKRDFLILHEEVFGVRWICNCFPTDVLRDRRGLCVPNQRAAPHRQGQDEQHHAHAVHQPPPADALGLEKGDLVQDFGENGLDSM